MEVESMTVEEYLNNGALHAGTLIVELRELFAQAGS